MREYVSQLITVKICESEALKVPSISTFRIAPFSNVNPEPESMVKLVDPSVRTRMEAAFETVSVALLVTSNSAPVSRVS